MIIAIDFDRVIHDTDHPKEGRKMGPPMEGAKEALRDLFRQGHQIIIHSCNRPEVIQKWMQYYEIPYHYVWDGVGKPVAHYYVDDRAVKFTSWAALGSNPGEW